MNIFDRDKAFSRCLGVLNQSELNQLEKVMIAIPGCGGVGGLHAISLARSGIAHFKLADFDSFGIENINRQFGARCSTFGKSKIDVTCEDLKDINPNIKTELFSDGINAENIQKFLEGVDLVIDGLDFFAFEARELLFRSAEKANIPLITAAPLGMSSAVLVFAPGSMSCSEYFDWTPQDDILTKGVKFLIGLAPRMLQAAYVDPLHIRLNEKKGPSHVVGVELASALATSSALKFLLNRGPVKKTPFYIQFDAYKQKLVCGSLWFGNKGLVQRYKIKKTIAKIKKMQKQSLNEMR